MQIVVSVVVSVVEGRGCGFGCADDEPADIRRFLLEPNSYGGALREKLVALFGVREPLIACGAPMRRFACLFVCVCLFVCLFVIVWVLLLLLLLLQAWEGRKSYFLLD